MATLRPGVLMGLTLIERYVLRKTLLALLVAAGSLIAVIWVVRAIQQVDVIVAKGQGVLTYLQITTFGVPTLSAMILPIALVIATIHTINNLNADSELVVMNAAGASRLSLIKPFLAAGLITAVLVYSMSLFVGPKSMQTVRHHITNMRADMVSLVLRDGAFRDATQGVTFHIASRAPGGILRGVFILDGRDEKETFTYLAREGAINRIDGQTFLVLKDGQIQRLEDQSSNVSVVNFTSYAYNLSSFSGKRHSGASSQTEVPTYELFYPRKDDALYQSRPGYYRAELHARLTSGLYPLAAILIIVAYMGFPQSNRQGQAITAAAAAGVIVALRAGGVAAEGALRSDPAMAFVVWGLPLSGIIIPGIVLATGRSIVVPEQLSQFTLGGAEKLRDMVLNLSKRSEKVRAAT